VGSYYNIYNKFASNVIFPAALDGGMSGLAQLQLSFLLRVGSVVKWYKTLNMFPLFNWGDEHHSIREPWSEGLGGNASRGKGRGRCHDAIEGSFRQFQFAAPRTCL